MSARSSTLQYSMNFMIGSRFPLCQLGLRILHRLSPLFHVPHPPLLQLRVIRNYIRGIQRWIVCLIWRLVPHLPEEPAFRIGFVPCNVQRPFLRSQTRDDIQAGLINGTFGSFCVLQRNAHLVAQFGSLILLELGDRLIEIILKKIEEGSIVIFGNA